MPANVVHSKTDENRWEAAKKLAHESYPGETKWPVVMHIFQNQKKAGKTAKVKKVRKAIVLTKSLSNVPYDVLEKAFEHRTEEWIMKLFGYAHANREADMGEVAGLGHGPTGEWTNPEGYGLSLSPKPNAMGFEITSPTGEALYAGTGKHELYTQLRKLHHGPFTMVTDNAARGFALSLGDAADDEGGGLWLFKAKKEAKTVRPLSDSKKVGRGLAFRQYGSAIRLKKPPKAEIPHRPGEERLPAAARAKSFRSGHFTKSNCPTCEGVGGIFVQWKSAEGEVQKGYRICPQCENDGQPLEIEKSVRGKLGALMSGAGKKLSSMGRAVSGQTKAMPSPKINSNPNLRGITVHTYSGSKGGAHGYSRVFPRTRSDFHTIAERERSKGAHVVAVDGPPHLTNAFMQERSLHHSSGGAKGCPGCAYHAKMGALSSSSITA